MPGGHKSKKAQQSCNISGLRNQPRPSLIISETSSHPTLPWSQAPSPNGDESDLEEDDEDLDLLIHFDSLKTNLQYEDECLDDAEQLEDEELEEWEGFSSEDLADAMFEMFEADDPSDLGWLPEQRKTQREKRKKSQKGKYSPVQSHFTWILTQCNQGGPRHIRKAQMSCPNQHGHSSAMLLLFKARERWLGLDSRPLPIHQECMGQNWQERGCRAQLLSLLNSWSCSHHHSFANSRAVATILSEIGIHGLASINR